MNEEIRSMSSDEAWIKFACAIARVWSYEYCRSYLRYKKDPTKKNKKSMKRNEERLVKSPITSLDSRDIRALRDMADEGRWRRLSNPIPKSTE